MDALALWYDADVYAYRQDLSGEFVLHLSLPGGDPTRVPSQLTGHQIWGRSELFSPQTPRAIDELNWSRAMGQTLFLPIVVDHSTEWLLAVSGSVDDPVITDTLSVLGRIAGTLLTDVQRQSVERLTRRLTSILLFGDAPFHPTARIALEAVAQETGASSVQFAAFGPRPDEPVTALQWGGAETDVPAFVDAGTTTLSPEAIAVGVGAGSAHHRGPEPAAKVGSVRAEQPASGALGSVDHRRLALRIADQRRTKCACPAHAITAPIWRGGCARKSIISVTSATAAPSRSCLPQREAPTGPAIDQAVELIEDHVRPSDVIGIVGMAGAGVLLADATRDVASAVVGRLLRAAKERGSTPSASGWRCSPRPPNHPNRCSNER